MLVYTVGLTQRVIAPKNMSDAWKSAPSKTSRHMENQNTKDYITGICCIKEHACDALKEAGGDGRGNELPEGVEQPAHARHSRSAHGLRAVSEGVPQLLKLLSQQLVRLLVARVRVLRFESTLHKDTSGSLKKLVQLHFVKSQVLLHFR